MADAISDDDFGMKKSKSVQSMERPKSPLVFAAPVPHLSSTPLQPFRKPVAKGSKFGAVKASNVNFDQLEARAREEQSFNESLGQPEPPTGAGAKPEVAKPLRLESPVGHEEPSKPQAPLSKEQEVAIERLGMGMRKMSAGHVKSLSNGSAKQPVKTTSYVDEGDAQKRFAGAKSVSSDQYFQREDTAEHAYTKQERMRNIQGMNSVSSTQFFGQEEEAGGLGSPNGGMGHSIMEAFESFLRRSDGEDAKEQDE